VPGLVPEALGLVGDVLGPVDDVLGPTMVLDRTLVELGLVCWFELDPGPELVAPLDEPELPIEDWPADVEAVFEGRTLQSSGPPNTDSSTAAHHPGGGCWQE
jgi:hypothetical protein